MAASSCFNGKYLVPIQAVAVRLVFLAHCLVITYRVVVAYQNSLFWLLLLSSLTLLIEAVISFYRSGGQESKWFSPVIFCYLVTSLPPLWLLELQLMDTRLQAAKNFTASAESGFEEVLGVNIPISLDLSGWALAMEQALLFILIIGRWVLPKGAISRNQLSQILLVYLGMAADIMELFEVFKEEKVAHTQHLIYPILVLWSWSLLQYTFVITSTKARKPRLGDTSEEPEDSHYDAHSYMANAAIRHSTDNHGCCGLETVNADVLGIISTIVMQDGPFLCFRLYLLVGLKIVSQMMIFFTCKNLLVLLLQIYRLAIIYFEPEDDALDGESWKHAADKKDGSDVEMAEFGGVPKTGNSETGKTPTSNRGPGGIIGGAGGRSNRVTPSPSRRSGVPPAAARSSWEATEERNKAEDRWDHPNSVDGISSSEEEDGYYSNVKSRDSSGSIGSRGKRNILGGGRMLPGAGGNEDQGGRSNSAFSES